MAAASAAGFEAVAAPLLQIEPLEWTVPPGWPDAILFTSARAPGLAARRAPALLDIPAYAVGQRTAAAAVSAGFRLTGEGLGDGSAILAAMARDGRREILHLAGADTAPLDIPDGVRLVRVPVYAARLVSALPPAAVNALSGGAFATLLFSARTARHFRALAEAAGIEPQGQRIVCLSAAVAEAAGGGWGGIGIAAVPALDAALAAALCLWQGSRHGR